MSMDGLTVIIIATAILEAILKWQWVGVYFRNGIPLFRKSFQFDRTPIIVPDDLSEEMRPRLKAPVLFHAISIDETGFRGRMFRHFTWFSPAPVSRGLIRLDHAERKVYVTGYANLFETVLTLTFLVNDLSVSRTSMDHIPFILFLGILAIGWRIQWNKFDKVFRMLEQKYS